VNSSEKNPANDKQQALFDEAEAIEAGDAKLDDNDSSADVPAHTCKKQKCVSIPEALPREDIIYDLAEEDKICPHDGTELKVIGEDVHEQLDIIPA
jgi:transposase